MRIALVSALTATALGCNLASPAADGKAANTASTTSTTTDTQTPGAGEVAIQECAAEATATCGVAVETQLGLVVENVKTIEESFAPGALALSTEGSLRLQDDGPQENPCAAFEGEGVLTVAKCQPNLLGVYISIGKMPLTIARRLIPEVGQLIKKELDGPNGKASGRITFEDAEHGGLTTIDYEVRRGTDLRFILDNDEDHLFVDIQSATKYRLGVRLKNGDGNQPDSLDADVEFTDKDNWSTVSRVAHDQCPGQGDGPKNIVIRTIRASGLWKGKAALYDHSGSDICQTKDHPGQTAWFTDYVGDATQMTAAQYYLSMSDDPATFDFKGGGFDTLCVRIPDHHFCNFLHGSGPDGNGLRKRTSRALTIQQCQDCSPGGPLANDSVACAGVTQEACQTLMSDGSGSGTGTEGGDLDPLGLFATITNPFCSQKDGHLGFGEACDSPVDAIKNAEFLPASQWISPKALRDMTLCIPASLTSPEVCSE